AFLFHAGGSENPHNLARNTNKSFLGVALQGYGFAFDDSDSTGKASSLSLMHEILAKRPASKMVIRPYIGGEEVNREPEHRFHRFVIDFGEMTEDEARKWPELMAIVEARVKPDRLQNNR